MRVLLTLTSTANVAGGIVLYMIALLSQGASRPMDAFIATQAIVQVVFSIFVGSAVNVLVPLISEHIRPADRGRIATGFCIGVMVVTSVLSSTLWLTANFWVAWILPGLLGSDLAVAVELARTASIGLATSALSACLMAVCQGRTENLRAESAQLTANVFAISVAFVIVPRHGLLAAAWILVARAIFASALLLPLARLATTGALSKTNLTEIRRRLLPLIAGTVFFKATPIVDAHLATRAPPGDYTILSLVSQVFAAVALVIQQSLVMPTVGTLARLFSQNKTVEFANQFRVALRASTFLGIAVLGTGFVLLDPVLARLNIVFPTNAQIKLEDARLLLLCSSGLFVAGFPGQVAAAAHYAQGDTRFPALVGAVGFVTGSAMKIFGFFTWGVAGIALGTSLYQIQNAIWLAFHIKQDQFRRP